MTFHRQIQITRILGVSFEHTWTLCSDTATGFNLILETGSSQLKILPSTVIVRTGNWNLLKGYAQALPRWAVATQL